jgi:hypothetical protein
MSRVVTRVVCWCDLICQVESDWTSWEVNGQVAGYIKKYEKGFTFMTVRDAGHEVSHLPHRGLNW